MKREPIAFSKGTQLTVYIDNRKGTLAALAGFLGKHGVNIFGLTLAARGLNVEYGYSSGGPGDEKCLVLVPSDVDDALAALAEVGGSR